MNGYLVNFAAYTLAMIGFIALALFIYNKSMFGNSLSDKSKNFLKVENSLRISAAKTIYVLKAGNEKFLIASDAANTTLLAKLSDTNISESIDFYNKEKVSDLSVIKKQVQKINRG